MSATTFPYDEFETVFRVLYGLYIRPYDLARHAEALDFFGINLENMLIDVVNRGNANKAQGELVGFSREEDHGPTTTGDERGGEEQEEIKPLPLPPFEMGLDGSVNPASCMVPASPAPEVPLADEAIIICTTDERTTVVAEAAKALNVPYVRFTALFAEGRLSYGGEMFMTPPAYLPMQPVWVTLGDRDNILAFRRILHKGRQGTTVLHDHPFTLCETTPEEAAALKTPGAQVDLIRFEHGDSKPGVVRIEADTGPGCEAWMGLKFAPRAFTKQDLFEFLMPAESSDDFPPLVTLPGGDSVATSFPYFHIDSQGKACFTEEEATAASRHLIDMDFLGHLKARINTTTFHLPQERRQHSSAFFCNEVGR